MQRSLLKANLLSALVEQEQNTENLEEDDKLGSLAPPSAPDKKRNRGKDYSPISAAGFFQEALELGIGSNIFRIYYTPPTVVDPGHQTTMSTPSTPNTSTASTSTAPATAPWAATTLPLRPAGSIAKSSSPVLFICVHGAGYSGLAFASLAKELTLASDGRGVGVLTYDARGHGKTKATADAASEHDMSLDTLTEDLISILCHMFPVTTDINGVESVERPKIVLVGHSMGGAIVVNSCPLVQRIIGQKAGLNVAEILGVVVLDVVEGTALEALHGMNALISSRPRGFPTIENAIEWHVRTKTLSNTTSARISVPSLFIDSGEDTTTRWKWRTDLAKTEPFWEGWFTSLSSKFLACKTAKLLILAGADRLDKELMIGQMQGKFQQEVFPEAGHCLQEDVPEKTAMTLLDFVRRNDRVDILAGIKKVGQI